MAQNSKIEWTHHTFNPWRGCTKISAGCANCYAETLSHRNPGTLGIWGPNGTRVVAAESAWREPLKWDRLAKEAGERHRVFCASLADVFEYWQGPMVDAKGEKLEWDTDAWRPHAGPGLQWLKMQDVRNRLFSLIDATPNLDWLLLTKRPENMGPMIPASVLDTTGAVERALLGCRRNLWLGTSVENQQHGKPRIDVLRNIPAAVRFLSVEPLLEDLGQLDLDGIHWVIVGGESGPNARPCRIEWIRGIVQQCKAAGVPVFVKQLGSNPEGDERQPEQRDLVTGLRKLQVMQTLTIRDRKGGDIAEFPADLQFREFPEVRS